MMAAGIFSNPLPTITEHLREVRYIALDILRGLPRTVELDDLIQAGAVGLLDARSKYNPALGVCFESYARHRIRGAILDDLRRLAPTTRTMRRKQRKSNQASEELGATPQRGPAAAEIPARLGVSVGSGLDKRREIPGIWGSTISMESFGLEGSWQLYWVSPNHLRPDLLAMAGEKKALLKKVVQDLPASERRVVSLYYQENKSLREIGAVIGVGQSRVWHVLSGARARMRRTLSRAGVRAIRDM
jgi:RNA polymerase sigma factor for flagellar operon FliA